MSHEIQQQLSDTPKFIDLELITQIISLLGSISVIIMFTIPYKDIMEIYKTKNADKFPFLVLIVTIINTFFFSLYGLQTNQLGVIIPNGYGLVLNSIFWIIYVFCLDISLKTKTIITVGTIASIPIAFNLWMWGNISKEVTGYFCLLLSLSLGASPMQNLTKSLAERDYSYIPIRIVAVMLNSAILYLIYSILVFDKILIICNIWGILTSSFQIIIYLKLKREVQNANKAANCEQAYQTIDDNLNKLSYLRDSLCDSRLCTSFNEQNEQNHFKNKNNERKKIIK